MPHTKPAFLTQMQSTNDQWAKAVHDVDPTFFEESAKGQKPQVLWIGCADSRVPESVLLAAKPGDVFVHRNIANQFHPEDDSALSVLSYAIEHLGVEHVVVTGHSKCGGCVGAYDLASSQSTVPDTPLMRWLTPLVKLAQARKLTSKPKDEGVEELIIESVKQQVENIVNTDTIQRAWKNGKNIHVHGWMYRLETGTLKDLDVTREPPSA